MSIHRLDVFHMQHVQRSTQNKVDDGIEAGDSTEQAMDLNDIDKVRMLGHASRSQQLKDRMP